MPKKTYAIDMVNGSIFKNIIAFVVPLILGNFLQLLYNAADIIVVSRFAGSEAMASVGSTGSLNALIIGIFIGLSVGASVVVSRAIGARDYAAIHRTVHTSMFLSVILGFAAMILGLLISKPLLELMGTPEGKVLDGAVTYMKIYFLGMPASLIYNFGASILRAVGDTRRPLYILSFSGIVNVVLNLVFVVGFHIDVAGVAVATTISNVISALAIVIVLVRSEAAYKLDLKSLKLYKKELIEVIKVGLPAGIQGSVFSLSNTLIQSAVNGFGAVAVAGNSAATNIEGFIYTAMNAFYQATITAVSQNYGAKEEKRVRSSMVISVAFVSAVGIFMGVTAVLFSRQLLSIYIVDSKEAIEFAVTRMLYSSLPYFLCGIMEVQAGMLRGLGYSAAAMINSIIGACGLRVCWVLFVLPLNHTPEVLFLCWPISWMVVILMHGSYYLFIKKKAMQKMYEV